MDSLDAMLRPPKPTSDRPLLGSTVLVVEDSRYACEALRLMCLRSGARIRRADSLRAAHRHLQTYRPTVLVADLGLPDGSGADLIQMIASTDTRPTVILGLSGDPDGEGLAMDAGADGFLPKPLANLAVFQNAILEHMPRELQPSGLRSVTSDKVAPDAVAFRDDMAHVADLLRGTPNDDVLGYVVQFLSGVALSAGDTDLGLTLERLKSGQGSSTVAALRRAVDTRMSEVSAI